MNRKPKETQADKLYKQAKKEMKDTEDVVMGLDQAMGTIEDVLRLVVALVENENGTVSLKSVAPFHKKDSLLRFVRVALSKLIDSLEED
jgi:hypothetical protein